MTEAEALEELQAMLDWQSVPALSVSEVTLCLNRSKRVDSDGLAPTDDDWTPTWNLNIGAAHGWRLKAAKVAALHDYSTPGLNMSKSQIREGCLAMANEYARKIAATVSVPGVMAREDDDDD